MLEKHAQGSPISSDNAFQWVDLPEFWRVDLLEFMSPN